MFLARMVTRAKWEGRDGLAAAEIAADAVTGDLRTQRNALSFWECGAGTPDDVEDAALAIAAGRDDVAKIEVVWLADDDLIADGQTLRNTEGRTPVTELVPRHVDVCQLDYVRLGTLARRVRRALEAERYLLLTRARVARILAAAVTHGRVGLGDLEAKAQVVVGRELEATADSD